MNTPALLGKKRKLGQRDSLGFGADGMDIKMAMGMAMDMGLGGDEDGEDLMGMSEDSMVCHHSVGECRIRAEIKSSSNPLRSTGISRTFP